MKFFAFMFFVAGSFIFSPVANAGHIWVWSGKNIEVYVDDKSIEKHIQDEGFDVTVIDVIFDGDVSNTSRLNFHRRQDNWYYGVVGKRSDTPVSKQNSSGYIFEYVANLIYPQPEPEDSGEEYY